MRLHGDDLAFWKGLSQPRGRFLVVSQRDYIRCNLLYYAQKIGPLVAERYPICYTQLGDGVSAFTLVVIGWSPLYSFDIFISGHDDEKLAAHG